MALVVEGPISGGQRTREAKPGYDRPACAARPLGQLGLRFGAIMTIANRASFLD
jgi:hypothetical protein